MSRVVAIVGSYRRGGTTDAAVEAILAGAREKGAETHTIYLTEHHPVLHQLPQMRAGRG